MEEGRQIFLFHFVDQVDGSVRSEVKDVLLLDSVFSNCVR